MSDDHNEAMRLADACKHGWLENVDPDKCSLDDLLALLRKQAERIAELEARVHTCGPTCSKAGCINRRLTAERDTLRAEVERLRVDAERYKWLRDNHESDWAICEWQDDPDGLGYYRDARFPSIVDAAIDTARKATP